MPPLISENVYHHGDLRNALLDAGESLLLRRGVAALSLREVAKQAGVSHAAPYRHFKGKAALMQALAESGFERLGAAIDHAVGQVPHDPEQKLVEAGVAYVRLAVRNPELMQLMFGTDFEPSQTRGHQPLSLAAFEALVNIIDKGIDAGVFRDREPRELALVAWASMHGLAMLLAAGQLGFSERDDKAIDDLVRSVTQNVIYGISR